jgi:hypothetical protein
MVSFHIILNEINTRLEFQPFAAASLKVDRNISEKITTFGCKVYLHMPELEYLGIYNLGRDEKLLTANANFGVLFFSSN